MSRETKDAGEGLEDLAKAGNEVLGSDPALFARLERPGNWALGGGVLALVATLVFDFPWWATALMLLGIGWYANDREAQRIRRRASR